MTMKKNNVINLLKTIYTKIIYRIWILIFSRQDLDPHVFDYMIRIRIISRQDPNLDQHYFKYDLYQRFTLRFGSGSLDGYLHFPVSSPTRHFVPEGSLLTTLVGG